LEWSGDEEKKWEILGARPSWPPAGKLVLMLPFADLKTALHREFNLSAKLE
jgi:hypothetical protein